MGKISPKKIGYTLQEKFEEELLLALKAIGKKKDPMLFLELLTRSERIMVARRIAVAKSLIAGQNQEQIRRDLHVGQATIESVERWLNQRFENYRSILPDLYEQMRQQERRQSPIEPFTFRAMRRKYPLHFLLFNLLLDDIDWSKSERIQRQKQKSTYTPIN